MSSAKMAYGSYDFGVKGQPIPIFSYSRSAENTLGTNTCLTSPIALTFDGVLLITGEYDLGSGNFIETMSSVRELSEAFKCGGYQALNISGCDNSLVMATSGLVTDLSITPRTESDPFVHTANYSISMEVPSLTGYTFDNQPSGITSISENWSVDFLDESIGGSFTGINPDINMDQTFIITHNVSVSARSTPSSLSGIDIAEEYLKNELLATTPVAASNSILDFSSSSYYNHMRNVSRDIHEGSVNATETWVVGGISGVSESVDVTVEENFDSFFKTVNINGTIQGHGTLSYSNGVPTVSESKIDRAYAHYNNMSGNIYNVANAFVSETLNPVALNKSTSHSTKAGIINYTYSYNTRPINCVPSARSETININETFPNEIFASHVIPGRSLGPLFQNIGTVGAREISISVEAILPLTEFGDISTGNFSRPTGYDDFFSTFINNNITGVYDTAFLSTNTETYNPKNGRFTKNVAYTVGDCS